MNNDQSNWRPICSAPKDKDVLIALKDGVYIGWYSLKDIWSYSDVNYQKDTICDISETKILGWLPIPDPPKEKIVSNLQS